jgi:GrpB-like predicted nucleotidyltransferase (UPF0157 family)
MTAGVVAHDPGWAAAYAAEAAAITTASGSAHLSLHHIGSTAVPGLPAKPIIDMLGILTDFALLGPEVLPGMGYEALGAYGIEGRRYFRKSSSAGVRTHHLHLFEAGAPHIRWHLAFRDYLRAHPGRAAAYAACKVELAGSSDYQQAKDPLVRQLLAEALAWRETRPDPACPFPSVR